MTTTLPLESHQDRYLFLENELNIGRAYRNRALELISICQLISQTASLNCVHQDAELKRIMRVCDIALRSAADSGSKGSDEINTRFKEATQVLSNYLVIHPLAFPLGVYSRMEKAKRKDGVKSVWSHVAERASLLLPKFKDEWGATVTINFVLLRSPLLDFGDPDTIVVSQEFSASPTLPEILWNFSRYNDRARITLEQNPHFYLDCPVDESAYTSSFQCHPIEGPSVALEHNSTAFVLFDGPSRVFLDIGLNLRIFCNVWSLNGVLIFRDRFGVLQGEQLVRGSSIRDKLWYYEQHVPLNESKSCSRLNHRCLRPIVATPSTDRPARGIFEDWLALNRLAPPSISIHIYGSGGSPESITSLELPPPPPTSELPGYPVQYTTINTLDDDVLFFIFSYYRQDEENGWNVNLGWRKLYHVCRRWRHLIHCSAFQLGMYIMCTNGTPIVGTLDHLPPLPLFIDYRDTTAPITPHDELAIGHALMLRDRVRHIDLHLPPSILHSFLPLMKEPFSMLEYLSLSYANRGYPTFILPRTFLAPNLRHLNLVSVDIPKRLRLLTTVSLVTLVLANIRGPGYFLPRLLAARLQSLPQLENFSIGFAVPIPRPSKERELLSKRGATVTLPNLKHLTYQGVGAYLECLVAQIRTPLLERLEMTFFNQIAFELPHLSHFINIIERLKFPIAKVSFGNNTVSVITDHRDTQQDDGRISIHVMCRQMDWQIDCVTQICNALMHTLFGVEQLAFIFHEETMPIEWQNGEIDGTTWHELLRVFNGVKELHIGAALSQELSRALQVDDIGSDPGFLPGLLEIVSEFEGGDAKNLFSSFVRARQIAGKPVRFSHYSPSEKARALYAYTANPDDPNELSFSKGEILDIVDKSGRWWQAEREDGTRGIIPSNYVKIVERLAKSSNVQTIDRRQPVRSSNVQTIDRRQPVRSSHLSDIADPLYKARALYAYTGDPDDPNEISFSKGELIDIINETGRWWQARKEDGTCGIIPSNCVQIVDGLEKSSNVHTIDRRQQARFADSDLPYKARALYAYTGNPDDPNEISFSKGEIIGIIEKAGKWWQARKEDGTLGIAPSNYLQIL